MEDEKMLCIEVMLISILAALVVGMIDFAVIITILLILLVIVEVR